MERDFIYRQTLVWLETTGVVSGHGYYTGETDEEERSNMAESLTNHLINNWEMVERAKAPEYTMGEVRTLLDEMKS